MQRKLLLGWAMTCITGLGCAPTATTETGTSSSSGSVASSSQMQAGSSSAAQASSTQAPTSSTSGLSAASSDEAPASSTAGTASSTATTASSAAGTASSAAGTASSTTHTGTPVTLTFQQGQGGYMGCKSVDISDGSFSTMVGSYGDNGTVYADGHADHCIGRLHSTLGYDISPLIRWDDLGIPVGSTVTAASVTFTFTVWNSGATVVGSYVAVPWNANVEDPNGGTTNTPTGWRTRDTGVPWTSLGATGEGSDLVANASFRLPQTGTLGGNGEETVSAPLDPAIVQTWVDNPASNHGIKLQVDIQAVHVGYVQPQREASRPTTLRPLLSITYLAP